MESTHLDILSNPENGESFSLVEKSGGQFLAGIQSGTLYPVRNGIPVFIDPARLTDANKKSLRYYDALAPVYRFAQSFYYHLKGGEEKARAEYLRHLNIEGGNRVLEISVGNGSNIRYLARDAEYFGVDVSYGQLRNCLMLQRKYRFNVELFQAEAEHLPFCDGAFDVVFNVASINYIESKKRAIDEMFRVAKPGAQMMIADETDRAARAHNRLPIFRGYFGKPNEPVEPPIGLLPPNATDVKCVELRNGLYYCLMFRNGY